MHRIFDAMIRVDSEDPLEKHSMRRSDLSSSKELGRVLNDGGKRYCTQTLTMLSKKPNVNQSYVVKYVYRFYFQKGCNNPPAQNG